MEIIGVDKEKEDVAGAEGIFSEKIEDCPDEAENKFEDENAEDAEVGEICAEGGVNIGATTDAGPLVGVYGFNIGEMKTI